MVHQEPLPVSSKNIYDMFLKTGGIFQGYVNPTSKGMDDYIQNSIVDNLYAYIGDATTLPREQIASAVYTVLYDAVHDVMSEKLPGEDFSFQAKERLLELGIHDVTEPVSLRVNDIEIATGFFHVVSKLSNLEMVNELL